MSLSIRPFNKYKDKQFVDGLFSQYNWDPFPEKSTPKTGRIVSFNGKDIAVGFMFFTDINVAIIGYIVADRNEKSEVRKEAASYIIEDLTDYAKIKGNEIIYTYTNHSSLIDIYKGCGYKSLQQNIQTLAYTTTEEYDFLTEEQHENTSNRPK